MMERWKGGPRGAPVPSFPLSLVPRFSPSHLQLQTAAVVLELHHLLAKQFIVRHHFEIVPADEVLQSDEVARGAVGRDPIARVVLLDATQQLNPPRSHDVPPEGVPTDGVDVCPAVPVADVLRTHHAPRGPVYHLAVDCSAVAIPGEGAADRKSVV